MTRRSLALALFLLFLPACGDEGPGRAVPASPPTIDTGAMEPLVAARIDEALAGATERPGAAEAWGRLAAVCHAHELYACADTSYARATELSPEDFRWPYLHGIVRELLGGEDAEVSGRFELAARLRPTYAPVHYRLGQAWMRQGRLEPAAAAFARALQIDPGLDVARRGLGQALLGLGRAEEAEAPLNAVLDRGAEDGRTLATLAQVWQRLGRSEAAREATRRAALAGGSLPLPDPVRAYVSDQGISSRHCLDRGKRLMGQGRYADALGQFVIVLELRPDDPELHHRIGGCYARSGRPDLAERHLLRSLELDPDRAGAYGELGKLRLAAGDAAGAAAALSRLVELKPDYEPGREMLARARAAAGS